jgi:hypothetical protein
VAGWIDAAKWRAAQLRVHPEHFPRWTREECLREAEELEACVARVEGLAREERRGPPWLDFEEHNDEL